MNNLQIFNFEENEIRTVMLDGEIWFILKDVCSALDIKNTTQITQRLDEDEFKTLKLVNSRLDLELKSLWTSGDKTNKTIINESGLYSTILRSDKPNAKSFRKWVTSEVLPSIRKTGSYGVNKMSVHEIMSDPDIIIELATRWKEEVAAHKETQNKLDQAEICLDTGMYYYSLKRRRELTGKQYRQHALKRGSEELGFERHKTANPHFSSKYTYAEAVYEWVDTFMPDSVSFVAIE